MACLLARRESATCRACGVSSRASASKRSISGWTVLALAIVVWILRCSISAIIKLRTSALRCSALRPSLRPDFRCRISSILLAFNRLEIGAIRGGYRARSRDIAPLDQLIADLLHRLLTEVAHREQRLLVHLQHLPDLSDIGPLETVIGAGRKIELLDRRVVDIGRDRQ